MQTLQTFFNSIRAPRLAELQCSAYLARAGGNIASAKLLAERDAVILEQSDWSAAVLYAKRKGIEVTEC